MPNLSNINDHKVVSDMHPPAPPSRSPPQPADNPTFEINYSSLDCNAANQSETNSRSRLMSEGHEQTMDRRILGIVQNEAPKAAYSTSNMLAPQMTWNMTGSDLSLPSRVSLQSRKSSINHDDPDYFTRKMLLAQAFHTLQHDSMRRADIDMQILSQISGSNQPPVEGSQNGDYVNRMLLVAQSLQDRAREQDYLSKAMLAAAVEAQMISVAKEPDYVSKSMLTVNEPDYLAKAMLAAKEPDYMSKAMLNAAAVAAANGIQMNAKEPDYLTKAILAQAEKDPDSISKSVLAAITASKEPTYVSKAMLAAQMINKEPDYVSKATLAALAKNNPDYVSRAILAEAQKAKLDMMVRATVAEQHMSQSHFHAEDDLPLPPPPLTPPPVDPHPEPDYTTRKMLQAKMLAAHHQESASSTLQQNSK